jgi:hypothetical protein
MSRRASHLSRLGLLGAAVAAWTLSRPGDEQEEPLEQGDATG